MQWTLFYEIKNTVGKMNNRPMTLNEPGSSKAGLLNYENIQESSRSRRNSQAMEKLRVLSNKNSLTSNMFYIF